MNDKEENLELLIEKCLLLRMKKLLTEVNLEVLNPLMTVKLILCILETVLNIDRLLESLVKAIFTNCKKLISINITISRQHFNMKKQTVGTQTPKQKNYPICLK